MHVNDTPHVFKIKKSKTRHFWQKNACTYIYFKNGAKYQKMVKQLFVEL